MSMITFFTGGVRRVWLSSKSPHQYSVYIPHPLLILVLPAIALFTLHMFSPTCRQSHRYMYTCIYLHVSSEWAA